MKKKLLRHADTQRRIYQAKIVAKRILLIVFTFLLSNCRSHVPNRSVSTLKRGTLKKEAIRRVVRRHINEVKFCYASALNSGLKEEGKVIVWFLISPDGTVSRSKIKSSQFGQNNVASCVERTVLRWQFPKPKGDGVVEVSYPFVFKLPDSK